METATATRYCNYHLQSLFKRLQSNLNETGISKDKRIKNDIPGMVGGDPESP
jgi:hypothetical protein